MELPIPCASGSCEQCSAIRFLNTEKTLAKNIATRLKNEYGKAVMPSQMIRSWVERFKVGRNNVRDDDRSGRPSDAVNGETTAGILTLFKQDRQYTITDLKVFLKEDFLIDVSRASICHVPQEAGRFSVSIRTRDTEVWKRFLKHPSY